VADFDFTSLTCVMPDCTEELYLTWSMAYPISVGDLTSGTGIHPDNAHTASWQVECVNGHVLLLPGDITEHDCTGDCPGDHSDEFRRFGAADVPRLQALIDMREHVRAAVQGYRQAIATLRDVAARTGSPAARWAADYLDTDPDRLGPIRGGEAR
jgi:hypothetical protein